MPTTRVINMMIRTINMMMIKLQAEPALYWKTTWLIRINMAMMMMKMKMFMIILMINMINRMINMMVRMIDMMMMPTMQDQVTACNLQAGPTFELKTTSFMMINIIIMMTNIRNFMMNTLSRMMNI